MLSSVRRWIGPSSQGQASGPDSVPSTLPGDDTGTRRARPEVLRVILRVVLRDVQLRAGLNTEWLDLEVLEAPRIEPDTPALHARLVLKFWAPRVLASAAQLERLFMERLREIDPEVPRWFHGLSWRLEIQPEQQLAALPSPWAWTAPAEAPTRH